VIAAILLPDVTTRTQASNSRIVDDRPAAQ
jgi:hypothetical protein